MRSARWHTPPLPYDKSKELARALGVSEILATVLSRRGYTDPEAARRFLSGEGELHDPFLFPQMQDVCRRIREAISSGETICIHGDYDVDGITGTALLISVLREFGAKVGYHLPNRFTEGYGVSPQGVRKIAGGGVTLLITVDCGIGSREEIELARSLGMETIVIDHHRPAEGGLPPATIISPLLCDYPFKELAGVGLAFKVAQGLLSDPGESDDLPEELVRQLDLVALGTIADVVPLLGENRTLVKRGLIQMARSRRPGLRALMEIGRVNPLKLNAGLVAFRLAPRINAAGRLDDPGPALELLLTEEADSGAQLAGELNSLNQERQRIENRMLAEAQQMVSRWPDEMRSAGGYVLSSPGWHEGVIGIVASKMVELHYRPVIMIAEGEEQGKGSGRSIPGFNLHAGLLELDHLLKAFGGHSAACGLNIEVGIIEEFRRQFARIAGERISMEDLHPRRHVDALVTGRELTLDLAQELSLMEPFGLGNPSVSLLATGVQVKRSRKTRDGQHFQCQIDSGGVTSSAIGFRQAFLFDKVNDHPEWDVIFRIEQNEFNGSVSPQLNLYDLIPRRAATEMPRGLCLSRCDYSCQDRVQGEEFWRLLEPGAYDQDVFLESLTRKFEESGACCPEEGASLSHRLNDRRGSGSIPGQVAQLASTGESVLLLVADVPRRRRLVTHDLPVANLDLGRVILAGSRCGSASLQDRVENIDSGAPVLMLADLATTLATPGLAASFPHVVFVDPPPCQSLLHAIAAAAPTAWLHLFYCGDEVQFTGKVIKHEFDLRASLAKVYKQLRTGKAHPLSETTERLLLAGGKYLRQPTLVARCLKVLQELALISVEERDGEPILILPKMGKTELERSPTFSAVNSFFEECQKYLNKSLNVKPI